MAITSQTIRSAYVGNGVATSFATGFYFLENPHVLGFLDEVLKVLGIPCAV